MTGLVLTALGALTLAGQGTAPALPDLAGILYARNFHLNGACMNYPDMCHHPSEVEIRRLRCAALASGRARCRFEERVAQFYIRRPRWRRAEYVFAYDAARERWAMDCRTTPSPSAGTITSCN